MGRSVPFMFFMGLCCVMQKCNGSPKWVFRSKYKPYGPRMCRELCEDPQASFLYLIEDLSCHRIQVHISAGNESRLHEDVSNLTDKVSTVAVRTGWDICDNEYQEKDKLQSGYSVVQIKRDVILHKACEEGEVAVVKFILSKGIADIESRNAKRQTPIMIGAVHGQLKMFYFLVIQGSKLSIVDNLNQNLLHLAILGENIYIVRKLIVKYNFNIESRGYIQQTPLLMAARKGNMGMFEMLINKGCNMRAFDQKYNNILHQACQFGRLEIVKYILAHNIIGIDSKGYNRETPVMMAAKGGHKELFEYLVSKGCNQAPVDRYRYNVFHFACISGNVDIVKYFLTWNKIIIDSKGNDGLTPVLLAAQYGHKDVLELLVENGCNLRAVDRYGNNILHLACKKGQIDSVKYLLKQKAVKGMEKIENGKGETPGMVAKHNNEHYCL